MNFCECTDVSTGLVSVVGRQSVPFTDPKDLWTDLIYFMDDCEYKCVGYDITHLYYFRVKFKGWGDSDITLDCGYYWDRDEDSEKTVKTFCYMVDKLAENPVNDAKDIDLELEIPYLPHGTRAVRLIRLYNLNDVNNKRRFIDCLKKWLVKIGYVG